MKKNVKDLYVQALIESGAFLVRAINEEPFTLRSGKKSYLFLNHSLVAIKPHHYKAYIDAVGALLEKRYEDQSFMLCNVDSKISAQMVGSLAYNMNKPQIIFKSAQLTQIEKGPGQQLTGDITSNLPVAIIDDVMTGGDGTAKNVGDLVKEQFTNAPSIEIFIGFIREPKQSTYETHFVLTRDELIDRVWDALTKPQQEAITEELKA